MRDLYHAIQVKLTKDIVTSNHVDTWLGYIDTQGFQGTVVGVYIGDLTGVDSSNYLTPTLYEADSTPTSASSYSAVAAADLLGGFTRIDATTEDVTIQTVGYKGSKRYIAAKSVYTGTGISAGIVGAFAIVSLADHEPASGVTLTTGTVS